MLQGPCGDPTSPRSSHALFLLLRYYS